MFTNISLEQSRQILTENCAALAGEKTLLDQAFNRVLKQQVYAPHDLPPRAQSAVDGYALAEGKSHIGSSYYLRAQLKLENYPCFSLEYGQAVSVQTGGILPEGTVAVVPGEKTRGEKQQVIVLEPIKPGTNIKAAGEDFHQGELLLSAGDKLDSAAIALLSVYGIYEVETVRKPKAGVVCLASNIIGENMELHDGQMRDSNGPMLNALINRDGGEVNALVYGGISGFDDVISQLRRLTEQLDIVVFTGGTFENGTNNIEGIMHALGARMLFQGVQLQPGSHAGAARKDNCLLLSLSGNPAACAVNYHLFVKPVLKKMLGLEDQWLKIKACCINGFAKKSTTRRMVRGQAWWTEDGWIVEVLPGQKPSMLRSLLYCNAFLDLPEGTPPIEAGQEVPVLLLSDDVLIQAKSKKN